MAMTMASIHFIFFFFFLLLLLLLCCFAERGMATIRIVKDNSSLAFASTEASFAPHVRGSSICGFILVASPLDGCSTLQIQPSPPTGVCFPFVLISRGNCSFDTKVRTAQRAGFGAAIIFDNEDRLDLITMAGASQGIHIYAIFVSKEAGAKLEEYAGDRSVECWILSSNDSMALSVMLISLISVVGITCITGICFIIRRHSTESPLGSNNSYGVSPEVVKAMPTMAYKSPSDDDVCAICLEEYLDGDELRVLPCRHKFHMTCIDSWLIMWQPFCPICKRNVHKDELETTPLLSSPLTTTLATTLRRNMPGSSSSHMLPPRPRSSSRSVPLSVANASASLEAFRASPYFTPPSLVSRFVSSSDLPPFVVGSNEGTSFPNNSAYLLAQSPP